MQKSAHTRKIPARSDRQRLDPLLDNGQKYEPFWSVSLGNDRRSQALLQKADQKR